MNIKRKPLFGEGKTLPQIRQYEFDWNAPCVSSHPSKHFTSLPAQKLQTRFGLSPSLADLIAFHAGFNPNTLEA
jgi:hypothetical protein